MNQENQIVAARVSGSSGLLPLPRVAMAVRVAGLGDLAFVDSLQRMHTKAVGWMPTGQLEGLIGKGQVLIAEAIGSARC